MCLNKLINEIAWDISWGSSQLDDIFDCKNTEDVSLILEKVKRNINEITIVESCRFLNIDYRQAVNDFIGEDLYE